MARAANSNFSQRGLDIHGVGRIDQHAHASGCGHQFMKKFQPLRRQLAAQKIDSRQVAARPSEAGDETEPDRVIASDEDDGDRCGCRLGGECRRVTSGRGDYGNLSANQFGRKLRQPIVLALRPAVFDHYVLALDIADLLQALTKCAQTVRQFVRRSLIEEPDHRHRLLLRARRNRPRHRAAKKRNEIAPPQAGHATTSQWTDHATQPAIGWPASPWGIPEFF
jgi:hypothetical protein